MIELIYGPKGSGKTKRLIDMANAELESTNGDVVFIDDDKRYMYDVKSKVRFIDVKEYEISNEDMLFGFISGMLAQNFDITAIYLDAFMHMIQKTPAEIESIYFRLKKLAEDHKIRLVVNVSGKMEEMPDYLRESII